MTAHSVGPVDKVPCPHCGRKNNMRELLAQSVLEKGAQVDCDACGRMSRVVAIDTRPRVGLVRIGG